MATPASKKNGKYMWFALLGLGFEAEAAASSIVKHNINVRHINLGPTMFDKPNKDASYIVIHFLFVKLNPTRFQDAYRHCWPVLDHKADAEFRKVTCAWLREIMDETTNAGTKVVASLFLSPGGPKFITLMLNLANHVMLQEMKSFRTGDSWVPEAAAMPASSPDTAGKRLNLTSKRFLKTAVDQDRFLQEYQSRALLLVKSMRDVREEVIKYNDLLKNYSSEPALEGVSPAEKSKKARSLWSDIDIMLSAIKEEQNAVGSVLKGTVDKYILDGTDRGLKVPRSLLERIEQLPHQLSSGNVYEAGQLNLLCVMELTTHALQILRDERGRVSRAPKTQPSPRHLQDKCQQMARVLQELHLIRQKISKEKNPEFRSAIRDLEAEWDGKWKDTLKATPLVSFLNEDPALGFLSPMAPLSFKLEAGAHDRSSVFSQYRAKLLEEKSAQDKAHRVMDLSFSATKSSCSATCERTESPVGTTAPSRANTSLDWLFDTPPSPPLKDAPVAPPQVSGRKTTPVPSKVATKKTRILDMECDNLADQFADAVTTTSPTDGRVKGLDLEGLLGNLHGDPFSTRKQLTRTPESLIMEVKSSWRKVLEEDKAEKSRRSAEVNESLTTPITPFREPRDASLCSNAPSWSGSSSFTPHCHGQPRVFQQSVPLKSTLLWDTFDGDALDCSSGALTGAAQFSLDHETLPEMPSCDSLLSLDDEALDPKSEEEDDDMLLIPSLKQELPPPFTPVQTWQACDDGSFVKSRKRTPECLLSGHTSSALDRDWPKEPVKLDNVFSLDLDTLETRSPPKTQEYSLPKLITFSPIDDMKC